MQTKLEQLVQRNIYSEKCLQSLKQDLQLLRNDLKKQKKQQYAIENAELRKQIELAKTELVSLEIVNGKKQIAIPGINSSFVEVPSDTNSLVQPLKPSIVLDQKKEEKLPIESKPQKTPKEKKNKQIGDAKSISSTGAVAVIPEAPIDVGRLDFRIGKIIEVSKHPDADSLYLETIDCGEEKPRTVVSGLVKFVPIEKMQNRMVVVMCNLKPAKMRGITSEAMVMCASTAEKVEILIPPANAKPGDLVYCEGYTRNPDIQLNPKKKIFETCAPDLMTNDNLIACFKKSPLHVPGKGNIVTESLKNVQVK